MSRERSIVVIGGGPAGLAVAPAHRDAAGDAELSLVCEEAGARYRRPPLTKAYLRGEMRPEKLLLEPPEWFVNRRVTVHLGAVAGEVRPERREVVLEDGRRLAADACVLATGSRPIRPPIDGVEVEAIERARHVRLSDGWTGEGDVVLLGAGPFSDAALAAPVGLEADNGAVPVDAAMRSGHPFVLAAGDVACAENRTAGRSLCVEHWGDAIAQGEIAGSTLAQAGAAWDEVPGFWSEIEPHTLKYAAWNDGYDDSRLVEHGAGAFTVWYAREGVTVGVLRHEHDEDYERGRLLIAKGERQ